MLESKSFILYVKVKETYIRNKEAQIHEGLFKKRKIEVLLF
jgi:hypothetical protein